MCKNVNYQSVAYEMEVKIKFVLVGSDYTADYIRQNPGTVMCEFIEKLCMLTDNDFVKRDMDEHRGLFRSYEGIQLDDLSESKIKEMKMILNYYCNLIRK